MTTDTTALTERIARAAYENRVSLIESDAERRSWPAWDEHEKADADEWRNMAAAVLPIVAAEVQAAKAEALREAAEDLFYDGDQDVPIEGNALLHSRADEYETGDRA